MEKSALLTAYETGKTDTDTGQVNPTSKDPAAEMKVYTEDQMTEIGKKARAEMVGQLDGCKNPVIAFACLAVFFAGQQELKMNVKLNEYTNQHNKYKECLGFSKEAHEGKSSSIAKDGKATDATGEFKIYMDGITDDDYTNKMDKGHNNNHNEEEWQSFIDVINQQKDMESTDLNKISTEMDMAVKASGEAQEMGANAIQKATSLMSTLAKVTGG